ncbi:MBOAT family protein [Clostridium sp.]|uniref:MBOAT family O-acyltransferase n=1 Tax=Clostridium sp. TaxID=1506 RepID=UPI00260BDD86|nr:MBOAT family O-acyltransferase [Clostridium sp.]
MSFLQFNFWLFLCILILAYYFLPKKFQWICLLCGSYVFYLFTGIKTIGYILFTTLSVWSGAVLITKINEQKENELIKNKETLTPEVKKNIKAKAKKKQKIIFLCVLLINFGILGFLKYFNFIAENITWLFNVSTGNKIEPIMLGLLLPLGISFYTFQSIGYLIDVYNGKYKAEKNLLKFALFVSFFPQIVQGPINRFDTLANQLYEPHKFNLKKFEYGLQLILLGLFKKMIIADRAIAVVNEVFNHYDKYGGGIVIFGILFYSLQQYTDFSGGIDVATGIAELLGINMSINFKRPYFSISLSEFWRRWHITLGSWMRDYIFYPLALTKKMSQIGKLSNKYIGKRAGKIIPVAISNIVVFLVVGIWHGPYWHYVVWGLYNGIIIAFSAVLEPFYIWLKRITKVNTDCFSYYLFRILRTFFIVNLGWYFDRADSLQVSFYMLHSTIMNFNINQLADGTILKLGLTEFDFNVLFVATIVLVVISVMQENGIKIREFLSEQNLVFRWILLYVLIFAIIGLDASSTNLLGGFMYAQF